MAASDVFALPANGASTSSHCYRCAMTAIEDSASMVLPAYQQTMRVRTRCRYLQTVQRNNAVLSQFARCNTGDQCRQREMQPFTHNNNANGGSASLNPRVIQ